MRWANLSALVIFSVFCTGCLRNSSYYIKKGDDLFASGKFAEASLNYRKAVQKDTNSAEGYFRLGRAEQRQLHFQAAWESLNRAFGLAPQRDDIRIELGSFCLAGLIADPSRPVNLYNRLKEISSQLLAKNPNSVPGLRFKGYVAFFDRRMDEAIESFRLANQLMPDQTDVTISLVEALFQTNQEPEAERIARSFIALHPRDRTAYDALYAHYASRGRNADAEEILKLKISNVPDEPSYATQLSQLYWRMGRQAQALDVLTKMLASSQRPAEAHLAAGDFYGSIEHWPEATQQFEEGIASAPGQQILFQKRIANVLLAQRKRDQAASLVDKILKESPEDEEARRIRAGLKLDGGKPSEVASAIEDYTALLQKSRNDPKLHLQLGLAYQLKRDVASAKVEFREAIKTAPAFIAPRLGLADVAMTEHRPEEAIRLTDEILSLDSNQTPARLLRAMALRAIRRYDDARFELERVIRMSPAEKPAYLQLGLLEIDAKNFNKAEAAFSKLQDLGGDSTDAAAGQAVMSIAKGQSARAYDVLKKELKNSPDHAFAHELLAAVAIEARQYDRAIDEYNALLVVNPGATGVYLKLAEAFRLKGDSNNYVSALQRAQKISPGELMPTVLLASAFESEGQQDAAIQQYRRALTLQPEDPRVLNNLAYSLCVADQNLEEALELAQRALKKSPDEAVFKDTVGWIYLKKKMPNEALQVFQGLVHNYPNDPTFAYHLGATLFKKGDLKAARVYLQSALQKRPPKQDLDKIRELLSRTG